MKTRIRAKEVSWMSFNARVLQEAADPSVPILDRVKFLGIFSSNLDEFFRVRVATLRRLSRLGKKAKTILGYDPQSVLQEIQEMSLAHHRDLDVAYHRLLDQLAKEGIFIVDDKVLTRDQGRVVRRYFRTRVQPRLIPVILNPGDPFPALRDESIYLAIVFAKRPRTLRARFGLVEVPAMDRFLLLPSENRDRYIILLDDVIRFCLQDIFSHFDVERFEAYTIKMTRDAELDIDDGISESYILKIAKSLKQRKEGAPVRFIYDANISPPLLSYLTDKLRVGRHDTMIPGATYHNFKDFIKFPSVLEDSDDLSEQQHPPLPNRRFNSKGSLLASIDKRDVLLHFPYQSFGVLVSLLREAAMDPHVVSVKATLYRIAKESAIVNALINAARNGKEVTAVIELRARFDEQANIELANKLQDEGIQVVQGVPKLKVHAKLLLITRRVERRTLLTACVGTGNFNEVTARIYSDHCLLTSDERIAREVRTLFDFLERQYPVASYKHLIVSPFSVRQVLSQLVRNEIRNAGKGREAFIHLKVNNLTDPEMIHLLYEACEAGVKIRLNVRGMFSLLPDYPAHKENIEAIGIVDKYLEHSRIMVFCSGGTPKYFLSSADWMPRNLDGRVEVGVPIYDTALQAELRTFLDIQWKDNLKARILDQDLENRYRRISPSEPIRAQVAFYDALRERHSREKPSPGNERGSRWDGTTESRSLLPFDSKKRFRQPSA